jgi:putative ABC transport system permease protein
MGWSSAKRTIKLGIKSLWMHRLRSALTTLGIVFGVCSVIAMLAIGEGASQEAQELIARLGSRNLIVETVEPPEERADTSNTGRRMRTYGLTYKDAESIRNSLPDVEVVVPIREIDQEARYGSRKVAIKIVGTIPWYTEVSPIHVVHGRFLSSIDLHQQQSVCVVDEQLVNGLFGFDEPVGKDIRIKGNCYRVVGVVGTPPMGGKRGDSASAAPGGNGFPKWGYGQRLSALINRKVPVHRVKRQLHRGQRKHRKSATAKDHREGEVNRPGRAHA